MTVYDEAINAIRGAGIEADALCRDGLVAQYAIVRLSRKTPFYADDCAVVYYECSIEVRVFAKSGLNELARRVEDALLEAGFGYSIRADRYDGEYQVATMEWTALEE